MGETRVDLLHLLEDLRDAYAGSLEETILTEIVANALDAGASLVTFRIDPAAGVLVAIDDGSGMQRRALRVYHDLASSSKTRGHGIGFAGVGIKLGLLACREVVTESRRGRTNVATAWHLASRHKAPWRWIDPPGLLGSHGTGVRLQPHNVLSPLLDPGFVEQTLVEHFGALLDPFFGSFLASAYSRGVRLMVDGRGLSSEAEPTGARGRLEVRLPRRRKPVAVGYLARTDHGLPEGRQGLAVSTLGKVIKRGWDWLGLSPTDPARVSGLIEVPGLAACLTLNKNDFVRTGPRGATYLAYRKAIQEAVSRQLTAWGDARETPVGPRPKVVALTRDLAHVLRDLADSFPLLESLLEQRRGGQTRLPMAAEPAGAEASAGSAPAVQGEARPFAGGVDPPLPHEPAINRGESPSARPPPGEAAAGHLAEPGGDRPAAGQSDLGGAATRRGPRRTRLGIGLQFEERPGDPELARLVESTVWINQTHPAYRRAQQSRELGYHVALSVALALAPLAAEAADERRFVTTFLAEWGRALEKSGKGRRR